MNYLLLLVTTLQTILFSTFRFKIFDLETYWKHISLNGMSNNYLTLFLDDAIMDSQLYFYSSMSIRKTGKIAAKIYLILIWESKSFLSAIVYKTNKKYFEILTSYLNDLFEIKLTSLWFQSHVATFWICTESTFFSISRV